MRIVFAGTPEFAVPSLRAVLDRGEVVAVYTQPDRPAGRSGCVYTATTSPRSSTARNDGTANSGVPAKTILMLMRERPRARPYAAAWRRALASFLRTISRLSGDR